MYIVDVACGTIKAPAECQHEVLTHKEKTLEFEPSSAILRSNSHRQAPTLNQCEAVGKVVKIWEACPIPLENSRRCRRRALQRAVAVSLLAATLVLESSLRLIHSF